MKKEKLFKIGIINESTIDVVKDMTTFYTSDTELWLGFELSEESVEFDSAEILMFNIDDKSFVVRSVVKIDNKYWYELDMDIIAHHGEWKAQLQFTKNSEVYTSKHFNFRIENDLSDERPPKLVDITNWSNIKQTADSLIAEMKVAVTEAIAAEQNREEIFAQAEQSRQTQELEREKAEDTRQQAETKRTSAESSRVSAEEQRQIDHANRSSELGGKADKVVVKNLLDNGDFSDGVTGWAAVIGVLQAGIDTALFTPTGASSRVIQHVSMEIGHVYYHAMRAKTTGSTALIYPTSPLSPSQRIKGNGEWDVVSTNHKPTVKITEIRYVYSGEIGIPIEVDWIMMIDLTAIFGLGNEPTKEEMDELIKVTGYIDGEYALNNKEMLIWTLALIRRNRNAIITLGGTI